MFRGYRSIVVAACGLIAAVGIATGGVSYGLSKQAEYERQAQEQSAKHARYTEQDIRDCYIPLSPLAEADCIRESRDAQRANERNEQDLVAQRVTAIWTGLMGGAAIIGMMLSAVGVWLVKTTFDATREGNKIAREHMATDLRAWLVPVTVDYAHSEDGHVGDHYRGRLIGFTVAMRNSGRTPAKNAGVYVEARCVPTGAPAPAFEAGVAAVREGPQAVVSPEHPFKGFRVPVYGDNLAAFERREMVVYVYAYGEYSTIFDDTRLVTEVCYRVKSNGHAIGPQGQMIPNFEITSVGNQRID